MRKVLVAIIIIAILAVIGVLIACGYAVYGDEIFEYMKFAVC